MALEIKELIVKVKVSEEERRNQKTDINMEELKDQIIEECLAQIEDKRTWGLER